MADWVAFCAKPTAKVVSMRGAHRVEAQRCAPRVQRRPSFARKSEREVSKSRHWATQPGEGRVPRPEAGGGVSADAPRHPPHAARCGDAASTTTGTSSVRHHATGGLVARVMIAVTARSGPQP
jgi:hypothetical protein